MLSGLYKWLAGLGVALLAIGAAFLKGRSEGRELERNKHIDKVLKDGKKARRARRAADPDKLQRFDRK